MRGISVQWPACRSLFTHVDDDGDGGGGDGDDDSGDGNGDGGHTTMLTRAKQK